MILAGGRGRRMDIFCHLRPKSALPIAGRFSVIDFSLSNCVHSQIENVAVLTDYQRSHMANYLKGWSVANGKPYNLDILEPETSSYKGTSDAVFQNLDYLESCEVNTVLILAGDHVYKMDYRKMLAFHEEMKADATVGVVPVLANQAHRFGTVSLNAQGQIEKFKEKARIPLSNLASMGIYIFNKDILTEYLIKDAQRQDSTHDFGYAILSEMVKQARVFAYRFYDYWQDVGTVNAYYLANMDLINQTPSYSLNGNWPILTSGQNGPNPEVIGQGKIENSLISPGCVIKGHVVNSILSPNVQVEEQAVVQDSILMPGTFVGYHSSIDNCIVDESVSIGQFSYVGWGRSLFPRKEGLTIVGAKAAIPPCTAIGCNCTIMPKTLVTDFLQQVVPSNTTVSPASDRT